jgi:hypothetical protein
MAFCKSDLTYRALPWRVPKARFSQFKNGGKANEADYFVRYYRRRNAVLVVEKREAQAQDLISPALRPSPVP